MQGHIQGMIRQPDSTRARITIVEDEAVIAMGIGRSVASLGYEVAGIAHSAEEALEQVRQVRPDLVLMDIMLGGQMNGTDAARRLHSEFGLPVIYLTAYSDEATLARAKTTDPFGYLIKPFQERELRVAIEIALYKHNMEQERQRYTQALEEAIAAVKTLSGILSICSHCKKIRSGHDRWIQLEAYIRDHTHAQFSHGICPQCLEKHYPS